MTNSERLEKARFLFELFSKSYTQVTETNRSLDQKIHNMLSLTATLTTFFIGILYYLLSSQNPISDYRRAHMANFVMGTVMFFIVVALGMFAYKPWTFRSLGANEFRSKYIKEDLLKLTKIAAVNIADMEHKNRRIVAVKARYYEFMLIFLVLGVLFFVIGFIVLAWPYVGPLG